MQYKQGMYHCSAKQKKKNRCTALDDDIWFGSNSLVISNIHIADDVLFAPNAYVNFDVRDHSIFIGKPTKIIKKENVTDGYITMRI